MPTEKKGGETRIEYRRWRFSTIWDGGEIGFSPSHLELRVGSLTGAALGSTHVAGWFKCLGSLRQRHYHVGRKGCEGVDP